MSHGIGPTKITGGNTQAEFAQNGVSSITYSAEVRDTHEAGPDYVANSPAINRIFWVSIHAWKTGAGGDPTFSVTYNGVTMNAGQFPSGNTGGSSRIYNQNFWLLEADIPANGSYDVVVTYTGGPATLNLSSAASSYANVVQTTPSDSQSTTALNTTSVPLSLSHPADNLTLMSGTVNSDLINTTHNNLQIEVADFNTASSNHHGFSTYVNHDQSIASAFSTFADPTGTYIWTKSGETFAGLLDLNVYYSTTVSATATVIAELLVPKELAATIVAASTSSADLQRDRGYVATITAASTVTPFLNKTAVFLSTTNAAATITAQPFERAAELRTLIETVSTVAPVFDATRPLAATLDATSTVTATFGNTFQEEGQALIVGDYVELYEIDTTVIGGADIFRFIPHRFETPDLEVEWKGNTYIQFPVEMDGFEQQATGTAPPQPTMRVSNVNKFILAAVLELGDIIGAKVTRWRTYARFLDNGETPDPNAHYAPDIYYVQQKTGHNKQGFEFTLSSALDLPGIKLPRRQILKDQSSNDRNLYAPGVANVRFRGR